jgi:2-keto-4-pentenoate hydratase/2-oxohepta-3-ene-1,7-dioic acid hydratase in catechol pathway
VRLVTFIPAGGGHSRLGVVISDHSKSTVVEPDAVMRADIQRRRGPAAEGRVEPVASDMVAFFASGPTGRRRADEAVSVAQNAAAAGDDLRTADGHAAVHDLAAVRLLAPVPRPRRIRDYLTYRQHAASSGIGSEMVVPVCYQANIETVVGPGDTLTWPSYSDQLDFELEIGFFTAASGRDLTVAEAQRAIGGVTLFNDVSARDIQFLEMSMHIGPSKGKHFCSAMGPSVLTMDEVDEWDIALTASVNGEVWVTGTTAEREFSFAEVLAWASLDEPVYPGEFLAVGTVGGGCGLELDRWIQPGDLVQLEASGIGVLANHVGRREPQRAGSGLARFRGAPRARVQQAPPDTR